jgi:peptide deformylase
MALVPIRKYGDPVLRKKARPIEQINENLTRFALDMFQTMYAAPGIGLAAPQIGESLRLAVVDIQQKGHKPLVLINPQIEKMEGSVIGEEGCLSLPGLACAVARAEKVIVTALNEHGLPVTLQAQGLLARCLQHEIDHLNGFLIIHRTSLAKRIKMRFEIRRLKKSGQW